LPGVEIPTLCYLKEINEIGACRLCVVRGQGRANGSSQACVFPINEGMEILTNTPRVYENRRKKTLELLLSDPQQELPFLRAQPASCELQELCKEVRRRRKSDRFAGEMPESTDLMTTSAPHMVRDNNEVRPLPPLRGSLRKIQHVGVHRPNRARIQDPHRLSVR
jgi:NADP-reducing hydrogenase subunit HndD